MLARDLHERWREGRQRRAEVALFETQSRAAETDFRIRLLGTAGSMALAKVARPTLERDRPTEYIDALLPEVLQYEKGDMLTVPLLGSSAMGTVIDVLPSMVSAREISARSSSRDLAHTQRSLPPDELRRMVKGIEAELTAPQRQPAHKFEFERHFQTDVTRSSTPGMNQVRSLPVFWHSDPFDGVRRPVLVGGALITEPPRHIMEAGGSTRVMTYPGMILSGEPLYTLPLAPVYESEHSRVIHTFRAADGASWSPIRTVKDPLDLLRGRIESGLIPLPIERIHAIDSSQPPTQLHPHTAITVWDNAIHGQVNLLGGGPGRIHYADSHGPEPIHGINLLG